MNMHRYLLDTNIISAMVKMPQGLIYRKLQESLPDTACTSIIVASEIEYGLHKSPSRNLVKQVNAILSGLDILPFEQPAEKHYGEIRAELAQRGLPIGQNDLLIAAHTRCLNMTLVSNNVKEFTRVPNLKLVNWLVSA